MYYFKDTSSKEQYISATIWDPGKKEMKQFTNNENQNNENQNFNNNNNFKCFVLCKL